MKQQNVPPASISGAKNALAGLGAEAVDDQPHVDPAPRRRGQRVAHRAPLHSSVAKM